MVQKEGFFMDMENKLMEMDFSKFSKVKDTLKAGLLQRFEEELSLEDLDSVVAARGDRRPCKYDEYKGLDN